MKATGTTPTAVTPPPSHTVTTGLKEVLVPIDFSESSVQALRHVADMSRREKIHITLLNVIDESVSFRTLDVEAQERKRQEQHTQQLLQLAKRELGPHISAEILVAEGRPTEEITRQAARLHADLIVVGRHAEHGLQKYFHSQTASHVAGSAPCPVVIVDESFS